MTTCRCISPWSGMVLKWNDIKASHCWLVEIKNLMEVTSPTSLGTLKESKIKFFLYGGSIGSTAFVEKIRDAVANSSTCAFSFHLSVCLYWNILSIWMRIGKEDMGANIWVAIVESNIISYFLISSVQLRRYIDLSIEDRVISTI